MASNILLGNEMEWEIGAMSISFPGMKIKGTTKHSSFPLWFDSTLDKIYKIIMFNYISFSRQIYGI